MINVLNRAEIITIYFPRVKIFEIETNRLKNRMKIRK